MAQQGNAVLDWKTRPQFNIMKTDSERFDFLNKLGYSDDMIVKPQNSPTKDWAIYDKKSDTIHPVNKPGFDMGDITGALPMVAKGVATGVGAAASIPAAIATGIPTGGLAAIPVVAGGSAIGGGLEEAGEEVLASKILNKPSFHGGEIAKQAGIGAIAGIVPGSSNVLKGGVGAVRGGGVKALEKGIADWADVLAGRTGAAAMAIDKSKSIKDIVKERFETKTSIVANQAENMGEASGIDHSITNHMIEAAKSGRKIPLTTDAYKEVPSAVQNEIIPEMRETAKNLQKFARKTYGEAFDALDDSVKSRPVDFSKVNALISDIGDIHPEVKAIAEKSGIDLTKNTYTVQELQDIKNLFAEKSGVAMSYMKESIGRNTLFEDPATQAMHSIDGAIRGALRDNTPELGDMNAMYGEIMDSTKSVLYRARKGMAEQWVKKMADPDWKGERVVEPIQNLEAAILKYGDEANQSLGAKIKPIYDNLMDKMVTLKYGDPQKQKMVYPIIGTIEKLMPFGLEKPLGFLQPSKRAFGRIAGAVSNPNIRSFAERMGIGAEANRGGSDVKVGINKIADMFKEYRESLPKGGQ